MMARAKPLARIRTTAPPRVARLWRVQLAVSLAAALSLLLFEGLSGAAAASGAFLGGLATVSQVASTVPANGDVNPYGIAVVPRTVGRLQKGDVLVSNFNNSANLQGLGSTIVEISPSGGVTLFATIDPASRAGKACGGVGLTTALAVLRSGWVVVGSLPTTDGTAATATAGCLFVLDAQGRVARTITGGRINGPWDLTALDEGDEATLFVTNVLNGTVAGMGSVVNRGTVVRIELGSHGRRAGGERNPLRGRYARQPDRGDSERRRSGHDGGDGEGRDRQRGAERPTRAGDRPQRRHPHRQQWRRQRRGDGAVGVPGGARCPRRHGQPSGCGNAVRARRRTGRHEPLLRR